MNNTALEKQISDLTGKLEDLTRKVERLEKTSIVIVGDFDGTNIPITANGIRRKIATSTP